MITERLLNASLQQFKSLRLFTYQVSTITCPRGNFIVAVILLVSNISNIF